MLKVTKYKTIAQNSDKYLSFPDIIKSPRKKDRLFLIYREGNSHHPTWSKLILWISNNNGETWSLKQEFLLNMDRDKYVWNCPRLSYVNDILYITCDQKSGVFERRSHFKTVHLTSKTEGDFFRIQETPIPGMVPDKIIKFKDKLFCANHKIKSERNDLIQLVSWSRDNGMTWYDTNIMAHSRERQFCEASVVNMEDYLIAYLRDNSGHQKNVYTVISEDGIHWSEPNELPIFGQRVTALKDEDGYECVVGAVRDTYYPSFPFKRKLRVSAFEHNLENSKIESSTIDWEYPENQYHFGYTGMVRISPNKYIVVYYIKQDADNPFIKLAFVKKTKI